LVQRIDVVTGGASAAYGSGAVAGVVNIVLNDELEGFEVGARPVSPRTAMARNICLKDHSARVSPMAAAI
jgi:outer membrane receptor protein involved in Fe transport